MGLRFGGPNSYMVIDGHAGDVSNDYKIDSSTINEQTFDVFKLVFLQTHNLVIF
jgi:hypothetical protein